MELCFLAIESLKVSFMGSKKITTKYASAERLPKEIIEQQVVLFRNDETFNRFLSKLPTISLIVNKHRQVVYLNHGALEFIGQEEITPISGKRPGEIVGCVHSSEEPGGCGTSESCAYCGLVKTVLSSLKGITDMQDWSLLLTDHHALDMRVWAAPLTINDQVFSMVTIQDIRHEKRRFALEQVFFHDILNTVSVLSSTISVLQKYSDKIDRKKLLERAERIMNRLTEEIRSQQIIRAAEKNILMIETSTFEPSILLEEIINIYTDHPISQDKIIKIDSTDTTAEITTDRTLLRRILSNMIKNALEATSKKETITLGFKRVGKEIQFWIHNPSYIPRDVQIQIFHRSYSTKGANRGLGTYSMKLLSTYLDGAVWFETSEENGTTFFSQYPIKLNLENNLSIGRS